MTIKEASKNWGIKEETIGKYIVQGWFDCITCIGNTVILPDIPKPFTIGQKPKDDSGRMLKILKACDKGEYISAYMLGISAENFQRLILTLTKGGFLIGAYECGASNIGYHLGANGISLSKKSYKLDLTLFNLNLINL